MSFEPYTEFRLYASKIVLKAPKGKEVQIEIGPGSSFGAGHMTTKLSLRGIEEVFRRKRVKNVLDFGCGSGVLGISAKALGAEYVTAIDNDPLAVDETRVNALRNRMDSNFLIICGSLDSINRRFDLVIANLVTDELIRMSKDIKSLIDEKGLLLVSGISELKREIALKGFTDIGLSIEREFVEGGWVAMIFS
ncbi:MAG: 50S ribosomal protein L11 methyltransferase [Candidatus Dadabacteria bacterium]|nr:50S ribosomal protein L11 methyltransferase [Candidatus Dadabacteria bacterium]